MDITNYNSVSTFMWLNHFDCILHAAAYTNLTKAEEIEAVRCIEVNVIGTQNICKVRNKLSSIKNEKKPIIYISSDYVEVSHPCVYAQTKLLGEKLLDSRKDLIIRTSFKARGTWHELSGYTQVPHPVITNADWADVIAKKIYGKIISKGMKEGGLIRVGTEAKSLLSLAKQENEKVNTIDIETMSFLCGYKYPDDCSMKLD